MNRATTKCTLAHSFTHRLLPHKKIKNWIVHRVRANTASHKSHLQSMYVVCVCMTYTVRLASTRQRQRNMCQMCQIIDNAPTHIHRLSSINMILIGFLALCPSPFIYMYDYLFSFIDASSISLVDYQLHKYMWWNEGVTIIRLQWK